MRKTYNGLITELKLNQVLVFGGNTQFRHGKGTALLSTKIAGAKYGKGGFQGKSYCIITKDLTKYQYPSISKEFIISQIADLYEFLIPYNSEGKYNCGYTPKAMAEMFSYYEIPDNIIFEEGFSKLLKN